MALLSTLVEAIADVEGLDVAFVGGVARYLREAGMISQAGRGRGAAHMSAMDAAILLIGVNTTSVAKDAPHVVNKYRSATLINKDGFSSAAFAGGEIGWVHQDLDKTLAGVIDLARSLRDPNKFIGALHRSISEDDEEFSPRESDVLVLEVTFQRPSRSVSFAISDFYKIERGEYASALFSAEFPKEFGDRREAITITSATLNHVGATLTT